jgi:hypothetical protein
MLAHAIGAIVPGRRWSSIVAELESIVGPHCVLATNTSSLSITAIAGRLIGSVTRSARRSGPAPHTRAASAWRGP